MADRPLVHLDSASAGRSSPEVLRAVTEHLEREAAEGAYAAAAAAAEGLAATRAAAARLLGTDPAGVAFTESATASLAVLVQAWPWPDGLDRAPRIGVPPASWGPNLALLEHAGLALDPMPVDDLGVLDLEALERRLRDDPPDVVLVDHVASHRGLVQPVADVVGLGRGAGVPVWVDAAQALGHVDCAGGADAVVATSRKWLAGPRGVGLLAVAAPHRDRLRVWQHPGEPDATPLSSLESREAFVAGRLGLGVALAAHEAAGPEAVHARLVEVGALVRAAADDLPGWEVLGAQAPAGAITALRPRHGQDVLATRERLLAEHRVLTAACLPWRAPLDALGVPALRVSGSATTAPADLERLVAGLRALDD